jgi:subtilisin family serine protease
LRIGAPADADSILTIGAVDSTRAYVDFSSKGPSADGRVKPNVCARGRNAWVANLAGGIMPGSGTSFSSPIMAGAVTCFWQAHQASNNMHIIDAVQRSSSQYNSPDSLMGYGIPDFSIAGQFLLTGVDNLATDKDELLNIFPNPFFGTFNIVYRPEKSKTIDVTVTDMAGKKVFGKNYSVKPGEANTIVLTGLENTPKGQYVVTVKSGKQRISKTLMKE